MGNLVRTLTFAALCLAAAGASRTARATGTNFSWQECGTAGVLNKDFACDADTGPSFVAIASFVPPEGSTAITGVEAVVDIATEVGTMPSWWQFYTAGACRRTSLTVSADFANYPYFTCRDLWGAQAIGGVTAYLTSYGGAMCRNRLIVVFAWPQAYWAPVEEGVEYYAFRLAVDRAKSVAFPACAGCLVPVTLWISDLKLTQPVGVGDYRFQNPHDRNYITWQGSNPYQTCLFVPTRNSTWGAIKAQYR